MNDLKAKLAAAGDRETVELPGIGTVEVRTCRMAQRMEMVRLSRIAAEAESELDRALARMRAQGYLIAVTVRDPQTGDLIFDPAAPDDVASGMDTDAFESLGLAALRVCGLDKDATDAAKNGSGASAESSTASPAISAVLSKNSEDGSLHLSTVSG